MTFEKVIAMIIPRAVLTIGLLLLIGATVLGSVPASFASASESVSRTTASLQTLPPLTNVSAIAAGSQHTCAVTTAGRAKCWGYNGDGELGDGTSVHRPVPADVAWFTSDVATVAPATAHTCVLVTGGVQCWGSNDDGRLGDGTLTDSLTPVNVVGLTSGVADVDAGWVHTCALTMTGGVQCWGANGGRLGDGTTEHRATPGDVVGLTSGVAAVAPGLSHTCALTATGGVKCWGANSYGALGDGTTESRLTPVDVVGLTSGVVSVAAGSGHTCALTTTGAVKCWGVNNAGKLGDGTMEGYSTEPVDVVGLSSGVSAIAAGTQHTCALTATGGAKCWGANYRGALGDGTPENRSTPVNVVGLTSGVAAIAASTGRTCALTTAGRVKCWGENWYGQLGDGTRTHSFTPVDVLDRLRSYMTLISTSY